MTIDLPVGSPNGPWDDDDHDDRREPEDEATRGDRRYHELAEGDRPRTLAETIIVTYMRDDAERAERKERP